MSYRSLFVKNWRDIDLSFGLVYPNVRKIGMSSYAMRLLYYIINLNNNIACEQIFLPDKVKYPANKISNYQTRSDISNAPLDDFDILGFSVQFENDFKNILWILDDSSIPLTFQERENQIKDDESLYPLIIAGGPVITSNPIPFSRFFDIMFIGDAEPNLDIFLKIVTNYVNREINYKEFLDHAQKLEGLFVPSLENKVKRVFQKDLSVTQIPDIQDSMKSSDGKNIFGNNYFVEINRGCPFNCNFCISSFHNSPFRNRSYEEVIKAIDKGISFSEFNAISMIGSCVSAHPRFEEICRYLVNKGKRFTVPSIRIEHLNSNLIKILEGGGTKTITIAPETGSEKLRFEMGKKISNQQIYSVIKEIYESQIQNIKLYFLIGLPNETDRDIQDTISMLKDISTLGFSKDSIRVNINPMIPKLNTPYENKVDFYLKEKQDYLRTTLQTITNELKNIHSIKLKILNIKNIIKNARLQTLISLGDKDTSIFLEAYYKEGANFGALRRAENQSDFNVNDYYIKIKNGYSPWKIN